MGTVANTMEQWHNGHMCMVKDATKWLTKRKMTLHNHDGYDTRLELVN